MQIIRSWGKEIALLIFGAILATIGNYLIANKSEDIPYFDQFFSNDKSIISKQNLFSHDVKLLIDDKEIDKISKFEIGLINYSDKYYKDIEVAVRIKIKDADFKILSTHAFGGRYEKELIEEIKSDDNNILKYKIKVAKRTSTYEHFFRVIVYYEGARDISENDVQITILNAEPRIREFDSAHSPENTKNNLRYTVTLAVTIILSILFAFVSLFVLAHLTKKSDIETRKKTAKRFYDVAKNIQTLSQVEDLKGSFEDLLYQERMHRWDSASMFTRLIEVESKPRKEDYYFDETSS